MALSCMPDLGEMVFRPIDLKKAFEELIAMVLFVFVGCGSACAMGVGDGETRLVVAFTFGVGSLALAWTASHLAGGQVNGAVTLSLVLGGRLSFYQGVLNVAMQLAGCIIGAGILNVVTGPCGADLHASLAPIPGGSGRLVLVEGLATVLLCAVAWEPARSPAKRATARASSCLAIGVAVFLAHLVLLPSDACAIAPTRSFGPAVVAYLRGCGHYTEQGLEAMRELCTGPMMGAVLAAGFNVAKEETAALIRSIDDV